MVTAKMMHKRPSFVSSGPEIITSGPGMMKPSILLLKVFKYLYLQHEHHSLHSVPLRLSTVHDDSETPGLTLLTARHRVNEGLIKRVTDVPF